MYEIESPLNLLNQESEPESLINYYNLLFLLTGLAMATYGLARFAESKNKLDYESHFARIVSGLLVLMSRLWHTKNDPLELPKDNKLITLGPHRTGWEAIVFASKLEGAPPRFFATDSFNAIPGVGSFMKMFKTIPIAAHAVKKGGGRTANEDALELASAALNNKGCVALFPQGNFSKLGQEPPRIYSGAAKLALKNNIPIHVIRLDGFWSLQNPLIPLFIRNNQYYRIILSAFHMNNVRTTLCCVIDFHLKPENAHLSENEKIEAICAELYAYYRHTQELTSAQISTIKTEIANKQHLLIWNNKVKQDDLSKQLLHLKNEGVRLEEPTSSSMRLCSTLS